MRTITRPQASIMDDRYIEGRKRRKKTLLNGWQNQRLYLADYQAMQYSAAHLEKGVREKEDSQREQVLLVCYVDRLLKVVQL